SPSPERIHPPPGWSGQHMPRLESRNGDVARPPVVWHCTTAPGRRKLTHRHVVRRASKDYADRLLRTDCDIGRLRPGHISRECPHCGRRLGKRRVVAVHACELITTGFDNADGLLVCWAIYAKDPFDRFGFQYDLITHEAGDRAICP